MRKNWFYKLLLSYLPALFIITLSLLLIAFLSINELTKKSSQKASQELSRNLMKLLDHTLGGFDAMMQYELLNNEKLKGFFRDTADNREYSDIVAAVALKELLANNPGIESVYLFRATDQMVLTPSTLKSFGQFDDRTFIGNRMSSPDIYRWTARALPMREGQGVVSLAKIADFKYNSLLVVNIKAQYLREMMLGMYDPEVTAVHLFDAEGHPILGANDQPNAQETAAKQKVGPDTATSAYTGWSVRNEPKGAPLLNLVSSLFYVWIAFGFVVIAAGIAWFVYLTKQNYRPVQTILKRIAEMRNETSPDEFEKEKDDFHLIESTIERLFGESITLQEQNKENIVYRKKHVFLHLLEAASDEEAEPLVLEAKRFGFAPQAGGAIMAIVEIDQFAEFVHQYNRDQYLLKNVLVMALKELAESKPFQLWPEWVGSQHLAVMFALQDATADEQDVQSMCEKLRHWVEHNLDFTVTIGLGFHVAELKRIPGSYRAAWTALQYKPSLGGNRIIDQEDLDGHSKEDLYRHLNDIRTLCQSFRAGESHWETALDELHRTLRSRLFAREELINVMNVLLYHLNKEIDEMSGPFLELWNSGVRQQLQESLKRHETADDLIGAFRTLLREAFQSMQELRESQSTGALIQNMKRMIDEHYADPNFSLGYIGDQFGLSGGYLSRLFKEAFGVRFVEYVTDVRTEHAKRLLAETDEAIQQIAAAVGYTNSLTFIRVFKKQTGITPGQYRKDAQQD
ncbi:helix-turn-helix domain-containing protein [Paenibacillus sp. HJGM_3]|uniref:helix-turn-helix domain-containing protein n=1 Tax=Paenibacillus sp. HJGM_3 TaxID=3379816 RepID=UPI0038597794